MIFRMRNVQTKAVEKIKTRSLFNDLPPPPKSCRLCNNVEKYCTVSQATDDSFACWITKATNKHSKYVIFITSRCNNDYTNAL